MHCLFCDDVSAFEQMRMYFTNPVNTPHNLNIKYLSQIILPVLKIRLKYKEY